jgi:hypothetical protein
MRTQSYATPGAGSDSSWEFYRQGTFQVPLFGLEGPTHTPLADGYGTNWEWDSMFIDQPGTYHIGGYVWWYPYPDSDARTGYGPFPGEIGGFHSGYAVNTSTCQGGGSAPQQTRGRAPLPPPGTTAKALTAPTVPALLQKIQQHIKVHQFGLRTLVARHTPARSGRVMIVGTLATKFIHNPWSHITKRGKVQCTAKIGRHLGPANPHHKLPHYHKRALRRLHRTRGTNACVWAIPKHTVGNHLVWKMRLHVRGVGAATFTDVHLIGRH